MIVYLDDQTSIYEYTNIRVEELPEELQDEDPGGKAVRGKRQALWVPGKLFQLIKKITLLYRKTKRDKRKMETAKIERINELYRKSKAEGLTEKREKRTADSQTGICRCIQKKSSWTA